MSHPPNIVISQKLPDVPARRSPPSSFTMSQEARRPSITIPAASWPLSFQARSDRRTPPPDLRGVYYAGEAFCEPPGSEHLVSENASATEPASLLAVFVADDGATLRVDDP